ncbi:hypothetical protein BKA83DRAFT_2427626 [Pisolithus microcarpus]|nr:hypothetical protein BKA83DRAFT_2427626 [Pisolithus microcarpus]
MTRRRPRTGWFKTVGAAAQVPLRMARSPLGSFDWLSTAHHVLTCPRILTRFGSSASVVPSNPSLRLSGVASIPHEPTCPRHHHNGLQATECFQHPITPTARTTTEDRHLDLGYQKMGVKLFRTRYWALNAATGPSQVQPRHRYLAWQTLRMLLPSGEIAIVPGAPAPLA